MAFADDVVEFYTAKTDTAPGLTMPKELSVGSKWENVLSDTTGIEHEVIGTEDVTVPAGTYAGALKVTVAYPEYPEIEIGGLQWWDKDEGVVKTYMKTVTSIPGTKYTIHENTTELQEATK